MSKCCINFHVIIFNELFMFCGWFTRGQRNVSKFVRMHVSVTWFQVSAPMWRSAVSWDVTQRGLVTPYLVLGKIGCPKTSVRDHQSTLRNILKKHRSQEDLTFALFLCLYLFSKRHLHRTMKTLDLNCLHIALSFLFHLSCNILYHNCGESLHTLSWQFFSFFLQH